MLARALPPTTTHAGREDGFTLIEVMVALVTGMLVMGALFTILEVSLHQTARVADRVQANQLGRLTMTKIVDELRSSCISPKFVPIQETSGASELVFISAYGSESVLGEKAKERVAKHKIKFVEEKGVGMLVDYTYPATGGSWPSFTFPEAATPSTGVRIGEYISQTEKESKKVPFFQYYKYANSSTSSSTSSVTTLNPTALATPLKEENKNAASVLISFTAGSVDGDKRGNRGIELSNQVTLSFSVPSAETPIEAAPCE